MEHQKKITWMHELKLFRLLVILTFGMRVFGIFVDALADCLVLIADKYAVLFGHYFALFIGDIIALLILFFAWMILKDFWITLKEIRWKKEEVD